MKRFLPVLAACSMLLAGCLAAPATDSRPPAKIAKVLFTLDDIRADGLRGPPDSLRSVAYEFCIPNDKQTYQRVRAIDPSLQIYAGSPGRSGCAKNQNLSIGQTHQPGWHAVLQRLAALTYVSAIRESFFE